MKKLGSTITKIINIAKYWRNNTWDINNNFLYKLIYLVECVFFFKFKLYIRFMEINLHN